MPGACSDLGLSLSRPKRTRTWNPVSTILRFVQGDAEQADHVCLDAGPRPKCSRPLPCGQKINKQTAASTGSACVRQTRKLSQDL